MRIPRISDEYHNDESLGLKMPPKIAAMVKLLTSVGSIASDFEDVEFRFVSDLILILLTYV